MPLKESIRREFILLQDLLVDTSRITVDTCRQEGIPQSAFAEAVQIFSFLKSYSLYRRKALWHLLSGILPPSYSYKRNGLSPRPGKPSSPEPRPGIYNVMKRLMKSQIKNYLLLNILPDTAQYSFTRLGTYANLWVPRFQ